MFCTLVILMILVWESEVCSCHCGHFQNLYVHWCKILNKILKYWIQKTSQRIYPKWWRLFSHPIYLEEFPFPLLFSVPVHFSFVLDQTPFMSLNRKTNKQTNKQWNKKIHRLTNWQICPQKAKVKVIIYFKRTGAGISICTLEILVSNFWYIFGQFCVKHFAGCW